MGMPLLQIPVIYVVPWLCTLLSFLATHYYKSLLRLENFLDWFRELRASLNYSQLIMKDITQEPPNATEVQAKV